MEPTLMESRLCGAKAKSTGAPCKKPAGWGTDHLGVGRCRLHGGATRSGPASPNYKHGGRCRSKHWDPNTVVEFAAWKEQVGQTFALEDDLLYLVWLAREGLKPGATITVMTKSGPVLLEPGPNYVAEVLDKVSRAWERIVKRHEGETIHVQISNAQVRKLLEVFGAAVGEHVSIEAEREAVLAAVKEQGMKALEATE